MMLVHLFISLLYVFMLGYNIVSLIFSETECDFWERFAFAFCLGSAFLTILMLFLSLLSLSLQFITITAILSIVICLLTLWNIRNGNISLKFYKGCKINFDEKYVFISIFLFAFILFETFYVFSKTFEYPMNSHDALSHWGLKGKAIFMQKSIILDSFGVTNSYPLLVPLMESWIYMNLGEVNDLLVKIIFPLFFLSLLVIFYHLQRRFGFSRVYALLFTGFLIGTGGFFTYHASIAYADLPFTLYYTVATLFLYLWIKEPQKNKYLLISGIFSGACLWTKVEGLYMISINVLVVVMFCVFNWERTKNYLKDLMLYFFLIGIFFLPWAIYCKIHDLDIMNRMENSVTNIGNILPMIRTFVFLHLRPVDRFPAWGVFWIMFFVVSLLNIKSNIKQPRIYLTAIVGLTGLSIVGIYLVIPGQYETVHYIENTFNRLLLHIFPVYMFWLAIHIKEILANE